jgi:hypothetical protein
MVKGGLGEAGFLDDLLYPDGVVSQLREELASSL